MPLSPEGGPLGERSLIERLFGLSWPHPPACRPSSAQQPARFGGDPTRRTLVPVPEQARRPTDSLVTVAQQRLNVTVG